MTPTRDGFRPRTVATGYRTCPRSPPPAHCPGRLSRDAPTDALHFRCPGAVRCLRWFTRGRVNIGAISRMGRLCAHVASRPPNVGRTRAAMPTWTRPLWLGALLVVGGSVVQIRHAVVVARALWVLAALTFVGTVVGAVTAAESSLPVAGPRGSDPIRGTDLRNQLGSPTRRPVRSSLPGRTLTSLESHDSPLAHRPTGSAKQRVVGPRFRGPTTWIPVPRSTTATEAATATTWPWAASSRGSTRTSGGCSGSNTTCTTCKMTGPDGRRPNAASQTSLPPNSR